MKAVSIKKLLAKILLQIQDSGWQTVSIYSGSIRYRKRHGIVYVQGTAMNVTVSDVQTTLTTLPAGYRPSVRCTVCTAFPLEVNAYVDFGTDGVVSVIRQPAQTMNDLYFSATFPA